MTRSRKRRTIMKSGNSARSTKTDTSTRTESSSKAVAAWYATTYDDPKGKIERLKRLRANAQDRLNAMEGTPLPPQRYPRRQLIQRLGRLKSHLRDIDNFIDALQNKKGNTD